MNSPLVLFNKNEAKSDRRFEAKRFFKLYFKIFGAGVLVLLLIILLTEEQPTDWTKLSLYLVIGFICQLIDGALGMAYGISSTTFLMSTGLSPAAASASVHFAEVFTTASSGFFHWRLGNIDSRLFKKLALPGALGAILGAFVLTSFDGKIIKPYISAYLLLMGLVLCIKAFRRIAIREPKRVGWLALLGGFADASGGGGWGPLVTTTLIVSGKNPKFSIGTVNAVEFFVALASSSVFTWTVGIESLEAVTGLILGGLMAAPLGAWMTHKINPRTGMILVGLLIFGISLKTFL